MPIDNFPMKFQKHNKKPAWWLAFALMSVSAAPYFSGTVTSYDFEDNRYLAEPNTHGTDNSDWPIVHTGWKTSVKYEAPVLFEYLSNSDFVTFAVPQKVEPVAKLHMKKRDAERVDRGEIRVDLGETNAGLLYSFRVEKTLCSSDFFANGRGPTQNLSNDFQIVVRGVIMQEYYLAGRRYLIFLKRLQKDDDVYSFLNLKSDRTYYRAYDGKVSIFPSSPGSIEGPPTKGIIELPTKTHGKLVERIESLCSAMRPVKVAEKLKNLRALAKSPDVELRENAEYAIRWFASRKSR